MIGSSSSESLSLSELNVIGTEKNDKYKKTKMYAFENQTLKYRGDLNTVNTELKKFGFHMVLYSNGRSMG